MNIVLPSAILTYLSFFTFLIDLRIGERLGFAIALALVIVAEQIVTSELTPVSDRRMFMDKYVSYSFYIILGFVIIPSILIGFLHYVRENEEHHSSANAGFEREDVDEDELHPLAERGIQADELSGPTPSLQSQTKASVAAHPQESLDDEKATKDCCLGAAWKKAVYNYPLRKIDHLCFFSCVTLYSIFNVTMILTLKTDLWLRNEAKWFDENIDFSDIKQSFPHTSN